MLLVTSGGVAFRIRCTRSRSSTNLLLAASKSFASSKCWKQVELDLGFECVETRADRACETCLRSAGRGKATRILDQAERATARLDSLLRERVGSTIVPPGMRS